MNGFFYTSVVLRRNECGCLHVHGAAVLGTDLFTWDTAPFADGAVLRGLWVAGLFHPLLCSFCGFTALFPKGTVLLQLLFACLFQGVTLFCVFPVVDRQCLVLARQCRKKKKIPKPLTDPFSEPWSEPFSDPFSEPLGVNFPLPLFLPGMWSGGRSESLPLPLPLWVLGGAPMAFVNGGKSWSYCRAEYCVRGCSLGVRLRSEARRGRTPRAAAGRLA